MTQKPLPSGISATLDLTEEAIARTHILALIYRYASLAREEDDYSRIIELFEPDAVIQWPDGRQFPPSQLRELIDLNAPKHLRHHLTTVDVQFVSPDEAHCQSYIIAESHMKMPDHWGRWDDVLARQSDGRWLFKKKTVILNGVDPEGWLSETFRLAASQKGKEEEQMQG